MLGRFLELALVTGDTSTAWQNWQSLGFVPAETGDIWPHAYGVVTCEGLAIGLHGVGREPLSLMFVQSGVAALHRGLEYLGIEVEELRLGADVFNELTLRDPGGVALRVLESRSFSPPSESPAQTALGSFVAISLPARDLEAAQEFWSRLGYECTPLESPAEGFVVSGTPVRVHARHWFAEPALLFRQPSPDAAALKAAGLAREKPPRGLSGAELLRSDELALLLLD